MREAKNISARDTMNRVSAKRTLREHNEEMKISLGQSPIPSPYFQIRSNLGVEDRPCVTD